MKKRNAKKLQLTRETVRDLERAQLGKVFAGALPTTPIGTCTDLEPCMSTDRDGKGG